MTVATASTVSLTPTGVTRPCEREDLPDVTRLFDIAYFRRSGRRLPKLEAYLADLLFDAPCQTDSLLRSHVYEDATGRISGFLGTHPRTFLFDGRRIAAAACGQLMLHPDVRGQSISYRLCAEFYHGQQEFSFHGTASRSRAMHKALGACNPSFYGLSWLKILRPGRRFIRRASRAQRLGRLRGVIRQFVLNARPGADAGNREMPDLHDIETIHKRTFEGARLHPVFDADHLAWKLRTIMASDRPGTFARVVRDGREPIGWYVWLLNMDGTGMVVETLATPGRYAAVLDHLLDHAGSVGAESIGGYCADAREAIAVQKAGASLSYSNSTHIIHARDERLLRLFLDDPPRLSVFDGEGWLDFPRA